MKSIILIGDQNFSLNDIKKIDFINKIKSYTVDENRYVVEFENDYIAFNNEFNLINEYEKDELEIIPFKNPKFISIEYSSKDLLKKVMSENLRLNNIFIDDDDNIISIDDF